MNKIIAKDEVLEYCKNAEPGNKAIYFNMDAINELPDVYEVVLTELKFDIKKDFSEVGNGNMMPIPALVYDIAKAMGISGGTKSITEPVYETIDINPMLMKNIEDEPIFRKMIVGRKVSKYSTVMQEDGTIRPSSLCSSIINVWERCNELWTAEAEDTNGYDPKTVKAWPSGDRYFVREWTKNGEKKSKNISLKYDTRWKREAHFNKELKFAHAKAETKAHGKTIRELAGLLTGYTAEDLKEGKFIFAKFRKSAAALKLEQAAHLNRIAHGDSISPAMLELFAPNEEESIDGTVEDAPDNSKVTDVTDSAEPKDKKSEPTDEEKLLGIFQTYEHLEVWGDEQKVFITKCIQWLQGKLDKKDSNFPRLWEYTIKVLKRLEGSLDLQDLVEHDFY